jgi:HAD superfamily hydrolase (TIGR01456 family)
MDSTLGAAGSRGTDSGKSTPARKQSNVIVIAQNDIAGIKVRKQSANLIHQQMLHQQQLLLQQQLQMQLLTLRQVQPRFGICFDIDGCLARGTVPIPAAVKAFQKLVNDKGQLQVPVVFVTNALNRNSDKAEQISNWLNIHISPEQMIQSPSPLEMFTPFHDRFCLIVGQGKIREIAEDLGFRNMCTIEDVSAAYPLLDVVDHDNRKRIATEGYVEKDFRRIEAIILLGEPKRWESVLQLLVDLLRTDGKPNKPVDLAPEEHLPVIACNMDLLFMERACLPRYGHGAFLVCLEALYKKVTGRELQYTALVGKPSEITFRYAEHVLTKQSKQMGYTEPVKTMYLIGDAPDVDIVGSNLYQRYIDRLRRRRRQMQATWSVEPDSREARAIENIDTELPPSRNVPVTAHFHQQTVETVEGILVCTGIYSPGGPAPEEDVEGGEKIDHGHRDFPKNNELRKPIIICDDVNTSIDYILEKEDFTA